MTVDRFALRKIRQATKGSVDSYYKSLALDWVDDTPVIVPITGACENVDTLFGVRGRESQFTVERRYLAQTAQLFLEVELQFSSGVYTLVRSFRDDKTDERHLPEFELVEEEFATPQVVGDPSAALEELLRRITAGVAAMLAGALECTSDIAAQGGDVARVERAVELARSNDAVWPTVTYAEALDLLNRGGRFGQIEFGTDLGPAHEAEVVRLVSAEFARGLTPVFVTRYPEAIKFFNMKVDPGNRDVVLSADLLLPTSGESAGAAVREDDFATLAARLEGSMMLQRLVERSVHARSEFEPYLEMIAAGLVPPHAGYGVGLERVLQFVLDQPDIREVSGVQRLSLALAGD